MRTDERANIEVHTGDSDDGLEVASGANVKHDIGQSLIAIDADTQEKKQHKKRKRGKRKKLKVASIVIGALLLLGLSFVVYKVWEIGSKVFQGDLMGIFQQQELKMDEYGRSNVLIVGTTEDDPDHPGGNLTDSMMVVSVDQKKKDAYMFSIPRDLYVDFGMPCIAGYSGKINEYYACVDRGDDAAAEKRRMEGIRTFVGDIFGMDIQYVAHINTRVIKDAVNAVGGVTVQVDSRDPRGVLDSSMDWMCWAPELTAVQRQKRCPTGHYIDLPNGPNKMDGDKAMWFSRARGISAPTYGLEESNFDREKNQQLVLMALKDKAVSTGTLTDITKVMGLMEAMGDNLRTNIDAKEVQTIMKLASDIDPASIHRVSFYEEDNRLLTTGMINGQSSVYPTAGQYNYTELRKFIKKTIYATPIAKEGARIAVLNGGAVAGVAQEEANKLEEFGMDVVLVGNAPEGAYGKFTIFTTSTVTAPLTRAKLEEVYGVKVMSEAPPFGVSVESDFVIIIGASGD